jgi:hypothetical protein
METYNANKRPSKRLTTTINNWYSNEQERKETAKQAKELDETKQRLNEKILDLIDQGYAPTPGSQYGVIVFEQSSRVASEKRYRNFINIISERFPQYAGEIQEISTNLDRKAQRELETRRVVVCDENKRLESLVNTIVKAQGGERKTVKQVELVLYTNYAH